MIATVLMGGLLKIIVGTAMSQAQPFVPGEVLVRFAAGSEGRRATQLSAEATPPDLGLLTIVTAALGEQVDTPLRLVRLSGGEWLVLRVPMDELARRTADRLARCRRVARATREPGDSTRAAVRTTFQPGSSEARLLARARQPNGKAQMDSLVIDVARRIRTPLKGAVSGEELLIEVDLEALTLQLVERLNALPEIESAQPNYRLRSFGPRTP
jgi:hypothetical protein